MLDSMRNLLSHVAATQRQNIHRGILVTEHTKSRAAVAVLNVLQQNGYIRGYRYNVQQPEKIEILLRCATSLPAERTFARAFTSPLLGAITRPRKSPTFGGRHALSFRGLYPRSCSIRGKRVYITTHHARAGTGAAAASQVHVSGANPGGIGAGHMGRSRGTLILSTSRGILSAETAHKLNVGGELICRL
jgi:ribosomal protein S8